MSQADSGNTTPASRRDPSAGLSSPSIVAFPKRPTVQLAHSLLISALAGSRPHAIQLPGADRADLEERAEHLGKVLSATASYVQALVADAAENLPIGTISEKDRDYLAGCLSDARSEVVGMIAHAVAG